MELRNANIINFSCFGNDAKFEFSNGVNVIIGANATGKTHMLKLLYSACAVSPKRPELVNFKSGKIFADLLSRKLENVFRPDELSHLIRRGCNSASVSITWKFEHWCASRKNAAQVAFDIGADNLSLSTEAYFKDQIRSVFIPSREVLAMFPGFVPAYEERELAFNETYYDICKALMQNLLKAKRADRVKLVEMLEHILGGSVVLDGTKFYIKHASEKGRGTEAQLVSEGMRKLAMLAHLIKNGAVRRQGIVFWDEPESSLNPNMIPLMSEVLLGISAMGIQVFIATHDYLLTRELSLAAEYKKNRGINMRFFCLSHEDPTSPVEIETGETLSDLKHNPILEEFAAHYDREQQLFCSDIKGAKSGKDVR